jgi:hypothetical protein
MANTTTPDQATLQGVGELVGAIVKKYPAFAPLIKNPEIAKILIEGSVPGAPWSAQQFQNALAGTDWHRTTSAPARSWQILQLTQPAEAARQSAATAVQIHQLAATEGIVLSPEDLSNLTNLALSQSYNAAQIQQAVGEQAQRKTLHAGTIQSTATQLGATASDYGVPVSDQTRFQWAQKIAEGTATLDGFSAWSQDQAKALYPTLAPHIDQGMTVRQLASPYMQIAAQTGVLDNPDAVDLSSPKWSQALQSRDAKTGEVVGPMSLSAWQQHLMTDPSFGYDHTSQARDAANSLVQQLGHAFGVSA